MGADLYIKPIFDPQHKKWQPRLEAAARLRDKLQPGSDEYKQTQARVEECFEKMYERGLFPRPVQ